LISHQERGYLGEVIESFGNKATEHLFQGRKTRRTRSIPADLLGTALRKLYDLARSRPHRTIKRVGAAG
jgi:hypothetical protein